MNYNYNDVKLSLEVTHKIEIVETRRLDEQNKKMAHIHTHTHKASIWNVYQTSASVDLKIV